MSRLLSSTLPNTKPNPSSKFIANSNAQMASLADLDRKSKHATMRTTSNVFNSTLPADSLKSVDKMTRKRGAGNGTNGAMSSIMAHNEGPYSKMDWPSKKGSVTDKTTSQNPKQIKNLFWSSL